MAEATAELHTALPQVVQKRYTDSITSGRVAPRDDRPVVADPGMTR